MSETHRVRLVNTNYGIGFYKNKTATISDRRFSKISKRQINDREIHERKNCSILGFDTLR